MLNPFNLSEKVLWILQTFSTPLITGLITVIGWGAVFYLSRRNINADKKVIIKLQAYDNIKDILNSTIEAHTNLIGFMSFDGENLKKLVKSDISYEYTKQGLFTDFEDKLFRSLYDNARDEFIKLIYKWEQHEIVFLPLLPQRDALTEEYKEAIFKVVKHLIYDFNTYLTSAKSGNGQEEDREKLVAKMEVGLEKCNVIVSCLYDIRNNLQNYVYGDILGEKIDPRVADTKKYLTINTVMAKHKQTLEDIKNLNKPKPLPHRIWKRFLDLKNKTG